MYDRIHVDEKFFHLTQVRGRFHLVPGEAVPDRFAKNRNFIPKVMFFAANARPRWDPHRKSLWDGKLGIFAFVEKEEAKRSSKNRPAGTVETKAMVSVKRDTVRAMMIDNLPPAILDKWPKGDLQTRKQIHLDNCRAHPLPDDLQINEASRQLGIDVVLANQPANSPDNNIEDLSNF
jgi:hypothetical protein